MSSSWGRNIKLTIFGESHGSGVGIILEGIKPGIKIDYDFIKSQMEKRRPGKDSLSSARKEVDEVELISGIFEGYTTGTPITCMIQNKDTRSGDYSETKSLFRPSHADHTGWVKYRGYNDYRGSGHFSGRMTAGLVAAGAIALKVLEGYGIHIGSHITSIGEISGSSMLNQDISRDFFELINDMDFPTIDSVMGVRMKEEILKAKSEGDSVGGSVETVVIGVNPGIGDPFFESVESVLSSLIFSVPAVKGIEFGKGFELARLKGSRANDQLCNEEGEISYLTNNNGGILGGITNGMPIIFRTAIKPTPSIGMEQTTVDISDGSEKKLIIKGRHDPCIVRRIIPVINSVTALGLLDMIMEGKKWD